MVIGCVVGCNSGSLLGSTPADSGADRTHLADATPRDAGIDAALITPGLSRVGTGEYETFYLKDGVVYAYGTLSALLGLGTYPGIAVPPHPIATPAGLMFLDVAGGMALDVNHHVWTWGIAANAGSASSVDPTVPFMIPVDNLGNTFDSVAAIAPTTTFDAALKSDGTVWVWGNCSGGILGNGAADGGVMVQTPTQVPIPLPGGVTITKLSASATAVLALASDGSVWAWGPAEQNILGTGNVTAGSGNTPRKVIDLPSDIVVISSGGAFFYALSSAGELYGWGYRNPYLGIPGYAPVATPMSLASVLSFPAPVKVVVADSLTTHVILTDGTLWGWGDASNGTLGDGQEPDWTPKGCGWDFKQYDDMVYTPVNVLPSVNSFTQIFANTAADFFIYAQTADGRLYSWGRNKTGTLGNGVYASSVGGNSGVSANIATNHPNSWDVPLATLVTPFTTPPKPTLSPCCPAGEPDASGCL